MMPTQNTSAQGKYPEKIMRSPLGKARGLGSARKGVDHWWRQRLTAMGLIPLVVYVVVGLLMHVKADYDAAVLWLGSPINATAAVLLFAAGFYHAALGLQVIVEDYVSGESRRLIMLMLMKLVMTGLAVLSIFSILSVAFG
jgi:succinate dehydrogenase / fumarate reductase membrane anchor subunit